MNKLVVYLIAVISGVIGVFAFSPFDYWGLAYVSLGGLLFVAKNAKKSTALFATFLWSMGFFCFGVSWLNVSIHQFGGASLGVSYLLVGLLSAYLALYPMLFTYFVQRFQVQSAVIFAVNFRKPSPNPVSGEAAQCIACGCQKNKPKNIRT